MTTPSTTSGFGATPAALDDALSINEILRLHPVAARVLNAFGIDTCCGGAMSLAEAAAAAHVPCDDVSVAIAEAIMMARAARAGV